ncbi:hypothetical protein [Paludibacterium paludis]|uniref:Uncharacterized protein n=1 Tax=Paludibacterium paludis TaxID=1225769 RepID=A0A918P0R4_9NEIS|nr:hypothetical protein [Paludibacterium paludis]GGY10768.1 hypothetical protein GCM10011289_11940 [Paludibacterium paludis]
MTSSDQATAQTAKDDTSFRAPENENTLANLAMPLAESVLIVNQAPTVFYGILHTSRATTEQSDFYRVQYRSFLQNDANEWHRLDGEESHYHAVYNCAWVRVDHPSRSVTFGPKNGISPSDMMRGTGVDAFLFASVIAWTKASYPDYAVSPGMITMPAGASEDDKLQKHAFYASQGFSFEWKDELQRSGLYFRDKVSRLIGVCTLPNLQMFNGETMLLSLAEQDQARTTMQTKINQMEARSASLQALLQKERSTTQVLLGVLVLLLIIGTWAVI